MIHANVYTVMTAGAGHKPAAAALTKSNIYAAVLAASQALDDAEVPETERVLVVTPATYALLKQAVEFDHTEIGASAMTRLCWTTRKRASIIRPPPDKASSGRMGQPVRPFLIRGEPNP